MTTVSEHGVSFHGTRLVRAAQVVAGAGLSDAFGHVSVRTPEGLLITGPTPLAYQSVSTCAPVAVGAEVLPAGVPREAWIHLALAGADPATGAVCRAQPRNVAKATAAGLDIRAMDGHGALLGPRVRVYRDSRLIRDAAGGAAVAAAMGDAPAVVLRGNGAVTRGPDLASAVALMWLLDRSAELALAGAGSGSADLPPDEQQWWRERAPELLPRIYDYLLRAHPAASPPEWSSPQ